jgi:type VI protein secretion system component VasF
MRASDADREQLIDTLKDAFAQGRLTKDELGARTMRVLTSRTYAELATVTADIPARMIQDLTHPQPARARIRKPISVKTVAWTAGTIITPPALWAVFLTYYGGFIVLFLVTFAALMVTMPATKPARR